MGDVMPAALAHLGGIVRAKAGAEPVFENDGPRKCALVFAVTKGDDEIRIHFRMERVKSRWRFAGFEGTKNGEDLDLEDDFERILDLLGGTQPLGTTGAGPVSGTASAKRDRGVEVRTTTVIRT